MSRKRLVVLTAGGALLALAGGVVEAAGAPPKVVPIAGKPSHPPRMHDFNAGVQLLARCLRGFPGVKVEYVLNGWPQDEKIFDHAAAVVFYVDGGGGHYEHMFSCKSILNAFVWLAQVDVPVGGVESRVSAEDLDANLDPKGRPTRILETGRPIREFAG